MSKLSLREIENELSEKNQVRKQKIKKVLKKLKKDE
jgi:hypothetical protein